MSNQVHLRQSEARFEARESPSTAYTALAFSTEWNNYAIHLDYAAGTATIGINGRHVAADVPFCNTRGTTLNRLRMLQSATSEASNFEIDSVTVSTTAPPEHFSSAGDSVPDWWRLEYEIDLLLADDTDLSGDGYILLDNYRDGTDPHCLHAVFEPDGAGGYRWETAFTIAEGYIPAALDGQLGWIADQTRVTDVESAAFEDIRESDAYMERCFGPGSPQQLWVTFRARGTVSFLARRVSGMLPDTDDTDNLPLALAFGYSDESTLEIYDAVTDGWTSSPVPAPVGEWNDYAVHLDYAAGTAAIGMNGVLIALDIPFDNARSDELRSLRMQQAAGESGAFEIDSLAVATAEPPEQLSIAGQTIPYTWKARYAVDPYLPDDADLSGDGLTLLDNYRDGLDPQRFYAAPANVLALTRQVWNGIGGTAVSSLTSDPRFPWEPDAEHELTSLCEAPVNVGDNYGQRIFGRFRAPLGGDYTFWIASDDYGELWLTVGGQRNLIANVPGYTASRQWSKYAAQQSGPVELQIGGVYPLEGA